MIEAYVKEVNVASSPSSRTQSKLWLNKPFQKLPEVIELNGSNLEIDEIISVAIFQSKAALSTNKEVLQKINASYNYVAEAIETGQVLYGVTTNFGSLCNIAIKKEDLIALQTNLFRFLQSGAGKKLPHADIRAGMLLRANSLMRGVSGIRLEIIERFIQFLNAGAIPCVYELGSIGASGDLIPLAYVGGSLIGLDSSYKVDFNGNTLDALTTLKKLKLPPLQLQPKEALALINGTSMMTGIATNCIYNTKTLFHLSMYAHAFFLQAQKSSTQPFDPFVHAHKPHVGQVWAAEYMLDLMSNSKLAKNKMAKIKRENDEGLVQDIYSIRCLAQYLGPVIDGLERIANEITVEANSATDNPLLDGENKQSYHCGNFLGQYIATGMDQLRYYLGLLAKHLDIQIACLVTPAFNNGLPPSLIGNTNNKVNAGLKGLQLCGNSIMPVILFLGNSLADKFPAHAEQFNQNINSQGYMSGNLARQSIELFQQYIAICLLFGIQAVDLRTFGEFGHYDARYALSPKTAYLYEVIKEIIGKHPSKERPYIWNDNEQSLDVHIATIANDITAFGKIPKALFLS